MMKNEHLFETIVFVLLIIGGLNWGLVGFFDWNLVDAIFGPMSTPSRVIYALVGLSAVYRGFCWLRCKAK